MAKNVVVCCDGTGNQFGAANTNVVKLYSVLQHDPRTQVAYYHPGIGTMGSPLALTRVAQWLTKVAGLGFGYGLMRQIEGAYKFLMDTFEPGDRVYLFGFSRGAYTARSVAAALHMFGLVRNGNDGLLPYLTTMFRAKEASVFPVAAKFKATFSVEWVFGIR